MHLNHQIAMASSQQHLLGGPAAKVKMPPMVSRSWSSTDIKPADISYCPIKYEHLYSIGGFSEKMKMKRCTVFSSDVFSISIQDMNMNMMTDWCLKIYPNADLDDKNKGYIGVYLTKVNSTDSAIKADIVAHFVDKNGCKVKTSELKPTFKKEADYTYGFPKFMSQSDLKSSTNILHDDTLTIMCEITIKEAGVNVLSNDNSSNTILASASAEKYMEDMWRVCDGGGKFSDVTIVCEDDDREFHCHKVILAGRSPVFETMFSVEMKEKTDNQVIIKDMDADTLHEMLRYIYGRKDLNLVENATDLLVAAEKYDLKELKQICEDHLCLTLNVDNVVDRLILADLHCASNLRSLALRFFKENGDSIVNQKDCKEKLSKDLMWDIINVQAKK